MTGYNTDQITDYIDVSNNNGAQNANSKMILPAGNSVTIKGRSSMTAKSNVTTLMNTGNQYWLATRFTNTWYESNAGKTAYSENIVHERYDFSYIKTDGGHSDFDRLFDVYGYNAYGSNGSFNCALRPVITVSGDLINDKSIGARVTTDPFYKGKTGADAHGYVRADSLSSLLGVDIKGIGKIDAGLPVPESDMTWTKLTDGGYNSADGTIGSFDTSKYDYYIADRTTKLQVRLTGAQGYNNGVLALDTVCNNIYGGETSIKLSDGKTKKVKVKQARNAKFEDFWDESKLGKSTTAGYGATYSTDSSLASSTASGSTSSVITANWNRWTPTLFGFENINPSNPSSGYSDSKISSYNLQPNNKYYNGDTSKSNLAEDKRTEYAAEKRYPNMTVMYNTLWRTGANRNTATSVKTSNSQNYWLSSRSVGADWGGAAFRLRCVSGGGSLDTLCVFGSSTYVGSSSWGLRPVLVVEK